MRFLPAFLLLMATALSRGDEPQFLTRVRQLTFEGRRAGEGYFSPDGKKIIFQSEREPENPFYQIYILDLTSGETVRVSPGTGKTTCSFFRPGSDKVLFASTHLDPETEAHQEAEFEARRSGNKRRYAWDYDEHFDIFEANQDGTGLKRLTDAQGYDAEGGYSPDGTKIVFCSNRSAYPVSGLSLEDQKRVELDPSYFGEIYIMNADGSDQRRLTNTPGYDGGPFFSPDGKRVIWRRFDPDGAIADVYTMSLDGSDVRRITDFGAMSWAPYFHPSGDYIIFASNKLGFENFELFLVDARGEKEPVRVTYTNGFDGLPVFGPDASRLAWTSSRYGGKEGQLYLAQWNDQGARAALAEAPPRIPSKATKKSQKELKKSSDAPPTEGTSTSVVVSTESGREAQARTEPEVTEAELRDGIEYLASDRLEGRLTGSPGEMLAAEFIGEQFAEIGLQPLNGASDFKLAFNFTSGVHAGPKNGLEAFEVEANPHKPVAERAAGAKLLNKFEAGKDKDFLPLSFSDVGSAEGLLAFAGYGLIVPNEAGGDHLYDSYSTLDVKGRIVLVLRFVPENLPPEKRQIFNRYAGIRYKAMQARERGAVGLLVVSGPNSAGADSLVSLNLDMGGASSGIVGASINVATANGLLKSSGKNLKQLQDELDSGEQRTAFGSEDTLVKVSADLQKETSTGHNVAAILPPTSGSGGTTEFIVIGAHYDHLGRGSGNSSLAHRGEEDQVHYGADDNASGTAAMLEIAEWMAALKAPRTRGVIFAAWSGEEIGLRGSAAFLEKSPVDPARIVAKLNMDMIGRVRENKLTVQGVGSSGDWRGMLERRNVAAGFSLSLADDPYLPTDSTSFYVKGIPTLNFFSGSHEDYHRPTDTADKINYPDLVRVAEFVASVASELVSKDARPMYAKVERIEPPAGSREQMRVYLGTIPDYASEDIKGVKLSGVREGGPAAKAGLQGGDVIIEFGGQKITNVYDYTYALDAAKVGQPLAVKVMRDGREVSVEVVPEMRK